MFAEGYSRNILWNKTTSPAGPSGTAVGGGGGGGGGRLNQPAKPKSARVRNYTVSETGLRIESFVSYNT